MDAKLLNANEFYEDFLSHIKSAQQKILIQTMIMQPGPLMDQVIDAICERARVGVSVRILIDNVTYQYDDGFLPLVPIISFRYLKSGRRLRNKVTLMIERLQHSGAVVQLLNQNKFAEWLWPVWGRNHRKIYIVDWKVWIGGVNLHEVGFSSLDVMVRLSEKYVVSAWGKVFWETRLEGQTEVGNKSRILLDGGKSTKSCIYERVLFEVERSNGKVVFVSQFPPQGRLLKLFCKVSNQQDVEIYISAKEQYKSILDKFLLKNFEGAVREFSNIKVRYAKKKVHAKMLILDDLLVVGSHNLVETGILMHTAECALFSEDVALIREANTVVSTIVS